MSSLSQNTFQLQSLFLSFLLSLLDKPSFKLSSVRAPSLYQSPCFHSYSHTVHSSQNSQMAGLSQWNQETSLFYSRPSRGLHVTLGIKFKLLTVLWSSHWNFSDVTCYHSLLPSLTDPQTKELYRSPNTPLCLPPRGYILTCSRFFKLVFPGQIIANWAVPLPCYHHNFLLICITSCTHFGVI